MITRENFRKGISEAADLGIALVGPHKALAAALRAQHIMVADFFKLVKAVASDAEAKGIVPVLPLTSEVIEVSNNAIGSMALVAELMKRDVLNIERDAPEAEASDNVVQFPSGGLRH